nr:MAG TPA: hypothetical protein [Caudoviricetes sp.]
MFFSMRMKLSKLVFKRDVIDISLTGVRPSLSRPLLRT